jgi:hypothetical protein
MSGCSGDMRVGYVVCVYRDSPLYGGRDGTDHYDGPTRDYGVLYLGRDLPTESVFHKHQWVAA